MYSVLCRLTSAGIFNYCMCLLYPSCFSVLSFVYPRPSTAELRKGLPWPSKKRMLGCSYKPSVHLHKSAQSAQSAQKGIAHVPRHNCISTVSACMPSPQRTSYFNSRQTRGFCVLLISELQLLCTSG